jgi:uncharacterized membrane protein
MKLRAILALASATLLSCAFVLVSGAGTPPCPADADSDGVCDNVDHCLGIANAAQNDADSDGYGNICDTDVDNNCVTGSSDISAVISAFGTPAPTPYDVDDNGVTGSSDISKVISSFGVVPGPSGNPCALCPSPVGTGAGACPGVP